FGRRLLLGSLPEVLQVGGRLTLEGLLDHLERPAADAARGLQPAVAGAGRELLGVESLDGGRSATERLDLEDRRALPFHPEGDLGERGMRVHASDSPRAGLNGRGSSAAGSPPTRELPLLATRDSPEGATSGNPSGRRRTVATSCR